MLSSCTDATRVHPPPLVSWSQYLVSDEGGGARVGAQGVGAGACPVAASAAASKLDKSQATAVSCLASAPSLVQHFLGASMVFRQGRSYIYIYIYIHIHIHMSIYIWI